MFASRPRRAPRSFVAASAAVALAAGLVVAMSPTSGANPGDVPVTYPLTGSVAATGSGWAVAGALVAAVDENGGPICYDLQTDADGSFTLDCGFDNPTDPFWIFINPPSLAVGDDTVDSLGSALFPLGAPFTYAGFGDDTNLELGLSAANLVGIVKKQDDDSTVTASDVYMNAVALNADGWMTDTRLPLRPDSGGEFRATIPQAVAPHGVLVESSPNFDNRPGTFDDTYATAQTKVLGGALYNSPPASVELVMPRVNFWGELRDEDGALFPGNNAGGGYVGADIRTCPSTEVIGRMADAQGIVRLHVNRNLTDANPIRFRMNFGGLVGTKYQTYMLADDSGTSASNPMTIKPMPDNYVVSVFAGDDSDVGAQVDVNQLGVECGNVLNAQTNSAGQVGGYLLSPGATYSVDVTPSSAAQAQGYGRFQQDVTATDANSDGIYELRVDLLSDNLTIRVKTPDGDEVDDADIWLHRDNYAAFLGYREVDANGEAKYGLEDPSQPVIVQVSPRGTWASQGYASFNAEVTPVAIGGGQYVANVVLQPANVRIYVSANGSPAEDASVWMNPMGAPEGFQGRSDASGFAYVYIPEDYGLSDPMYIGVSAPWNQRNLYGDRQYQEVRLTPPAGAGQPYTFVAELLQANARFKVVKPEAASPPMQNASLEFRIPGEWMQSAWGNADQNGLAAVTLTDDTFDLFVSGPWNSSDDTIYGRTQYTVVVSDGEVQSVTRTADAQPAVRDETGRWTVSPEPAMFSATVEEPDGTSVSNSWVEVLRDADGWLEYLEGTSTNASGKFGLSLADDTYVIRARAPWGSSGLVSSRDCTLVINNGAVAAGTTCTDPLTLREPNLRVTIVDPANSPLFNAWACAGRDNDFNWICEGSGRDGVVSLLIDDTTQDLTVEANPPWNSDQDLSMTRVTIADDSFIATGSVDDTITLAEPNVRVQVALDDDTQAARWSWVSIIEVNGSNWEWIAGGSANGSGISSFTVDDTSGTFCVGVYPPWEVRGLYAAREQCGVSLSSGALSVNLRQANVFTSVVDADGRLNAFGWVQISQNDIPISGLGLDERGRLAASLDPGTYELTFYPGWQRAGSPTTITVVVDGNGDSDIEPQVALGSGNVTGDISVGSSAYPGVIVVASQGSQTVSSVTDDEGVFRMDLDAGTWTITLITPPGGSTAPSVSFSGAVDWTPASATSGQLVVS